MREGFSGSWQTKQRKKQKEKDSDAGPMFDWQQFLNLDFQPRLVIWKMGQGMEEDSLSLIHI